MNIYTIGVMISILVYLFVGNYAGKKVKDVDDYYVSGRNAPTILIAGTLFASMLSTNGFMGDTAFSYTGHMSLLLILNTFCSGGYIIGALYFGRYIRRSEAITMPEYFGKRFNSTSVQRVGGITTIISLSAYLIAVIIGVGMLMEELTGMPKEACLLIAWFAFTSFTFYSGSKGVILTDTLMFLIFIFATLIAGPFILNAVGGAGNIISNTISSPEIPKDMLSHHGVIGTTYETTFDAIMYAITMGLVWMIAVSVSPWQASRNLMAKNEHVTFRSGAIACICTVIFLGFLNFLAVSINLANPNIVPSEKVMIWACFNIVPPVIGVLVLTGIMAAGLSSASTFLSVIGFSAINDVYQKEFSDTKKQLWASRWTMLLVSLVALFLAYYNPPAIRIITWFASAVIAASWGPVAFFSVWSKKITSKGAYWGMIMGFIGNAGGRIINELTPITLKSFYHPFFIGITLSIIAILLLSKPEEITDEEKLYYKKLHTLPQSEKHPDLYKRDYLYANVLIGLGVFTIFFMLAFWALPFNSLA